MLGLVFLVVAAIAFLLAGCNQDIFDQGPADLVAWGLFFWVLSALVGGALTIYEKRSS